MGKYAEIAILALRDKNPALHTRLFTTGRLPPYLEELESDAKRLERKLMLDAAKLDPLPMHPLERMRRQNADRSAATETVVQQMVESIPAPESNPPTT